jgi:dienelactone hydrolase
MACDPANMTKAPTPVTSWKDSDMPPTGKYKVIIESDPGVPDQTIYRPDVPSEVKMPVIVWGEGGCIKMGLVMKEFLHDVASHGFLIIADGPPSGGSVGGGPGGGGGAVFKKSIDWAIAENDRPCSQYYRRIETTKIAASGQSCGGLMTLQSAGDTRLTTIAMFNSGLMGGGNATLDMVHTPAAYFNGGQNDIAYANGARDYAYLAMKAKFPVLHANNKLGHGGTYNADNGGECARVGVAWFRWHLLGDDTATGKGMFWGPDCGLCKDSGWTVESVNMGR